MSSHHGPRTFKNMGMEGQIQNSTEHETETRGCIAVFRDVGFCIEQFAAFASKP